MHEVKKRLSGVQILVGVLPEQDLLLARLGIDDAEFFSLVSTIIGVVVNGLAVREPFESGALLKGQFYRIGLHLDAFSRLNVKDDGLCFRQYLSRQGIHIGVCLGSELALGNELEAGKASGVPRIEAVGN